MECSVAHQHERRWPFRVILQVEDDSCGKDDDEIDQKQGIAWRHAKAFFEDGSDNFGAGRRAFKFEHETEADANKDRPQNNRKQEIVLQEVLDWRGILEMKEIQIVLEERYLDFAAQEIDEERVRRKAIKRAHAKGIAQFDDTPNKERHIEKPNQRTNRQLWPKEVDGHRQARHATRHDVRLDHKETKPDGGDKAAYRNHEIIKYDRDFLR